MHATASPTSIAAMMLCLTLPLGCDADKQTER